METMEISIYGQEAVMFEEMLNEPVGIFPVQYSKVYMEGTADGYSFKIQSEKGIQFFFIGKEWVKRMMIYHCEHYSFGLEEEDMYPNESESE